MRFETLSGDLCTERRMFLGSRGSVFVFCVCLFGWKAIGTRGGGSLWLGSLVVRVVNCVVLLLGLVFAPNRVRIGRLACLRGKMGRESKRGQVEHEWRGANFSTGAC